MSHKPKIEFSPIDAKEYDVVYVEPRVRNQHNADLLEAIEHEYLEKLDALQKEMQKKFDEACVEEERYPSYREDREGWEAASKEASDAAKKASEKAKDSQKYYRLYYT